MELAISVFGWTLAVMTPVVGIALAGYMFARKEQLEAQTKLMEEDLRFRSTRSQMGTEK